MMEHRFTADFRHGEADDVLYAYGRLVYDYGALRQGRNLLAEV